MARGLMARGLMALRRRGRSASRTDSLREWSLSTAILLSLLVVGHATRTMDYRAKAPAEYDNSMFYDEGPGKAEKETPQEEEYPDPDIKHKAIQAKPSIDADYDFKSMPIEPIRPKRQKMGRTKLQPPTKKPAQFKLKPEVLMAQYLHEASEPIEESEGGPARQRPGRWESKKDQPLKQSEDDYDYTAIKPNGGKSPEEVYDHHQDEYDDEYDRRSFDPRNDHLKFILQPSPKKRSRISVPTLTPSRWTPTRSTRRSTVRTPTRTVQTTTHSNARETNFHSDQTTTTLSTTAPSTVASSLTVIPLKKPSEPSGNDETANSPLEPVEVNQAEDVQYQLQPGEPSKQQLQPDGPSKQQLQPDGPSKQQLQPDGPSKQNSQPDEPSKEVTPLDGQPFGPTKPPVFARMRPTDEDLPTMVLPNSERPDALMVAEGMRHGPEVEIARHKIRHHLLSRGVDPDSDPDQIICEYVEVDSSLASSSRPYSICLFLFGLASSTLNTDLLNLLWFIL